MNISIHCYICFFGYSDILSEKRSLYKKKSAKILVGKKKSAKILLGKKWLKSEKEIVTFCGLKFMPTFFIPTFIPIFFQIIFMCCCFVGSCFRFVHDGHAQNTNGNEVIFFKENSKKLSRGTNTTDATHGLVTYIRCAKKTTKRKATRKFVCCCLLFIYTLPQD